MKFAKQGHNSEEHERAWLEKQLIVISYNDYLTSLELFTDGVWFQILLFSAELLSGIPAVGNKEMIQQASFSIETILSFVIMYKR